jgi:hypothetical protein
MRIHQNPGVSLPGATDEVGLMKLTKLTTCCRRSSRSMAYMSSVAKGSAEGQGCTRQAMGMACVYVAQSGE